MPNCTYELCGSETPICAKTYMTRPEQSNPLGLAPPHTYGTPRYCIATPTTPPCVDGGAIVVPVGVEAAIPTTLCVEVDWIGCDARRALAAAAAAASWRR